MGGGRGKGQGSVGCKKKIVNCLRHGTLGVRGFFFQGGYLPVADLRAQLGVSERAFQAALDTTRVAAGHAGPCSGPYHGHSADCGHDLPHMCPRLSPAELRDMDREFQGPFLLWHGTDLHVVPGIVCEGVVSGGGPGGRLPAPKSKASPATRGRVALLFSLRPSRPSASCGSGL